MDSSNYDYVFDLGNSGTNDPTQTENIILDASIETSVPDELYTILQSWGLSNLHEKLIRLNISAEALPYMNVDDINTIFSSVEELGFKILFRGKLDEWRKQNNYLSLQEISYKPIASTSSTYDNSNTSTYATDESNSREPFIFSTFMNTANGRKIVNLYNRENPPKLTNEVRQYLVNSVVQEFMSKDVCMEPADFREITRNITETFPSEEANYYYVPPSESQKNASGSLFTKYKNCSSHLRNKGIFTSRKRRKSTKTSDKTTSAVDTTFPANHETDKRWLSCFREPWDAVELKWQSTFPGRRIELNNLASSTNKITQFLNEWSIFKSPNGCRLVDIDFESAYPDKSTLLLTKWEPFVNIIENLLMKHIKDVKIKKDISTIKAVDNKDLKSIKIIKLLHYALPPTSRVNKPSNKKIIWKPSIADSISSFILEINSHAEIEAKLHEIKTKYVEFKLNLQPMVMIVGERDSDKEFITVFDGIFYKFSNLMTAIDCCFKLFFIFDVKYPIESIKVWTFFQHYFFNIVTKYDVTDSKLILFLSDCNTMTQSQ